MTLDNEKIDQSNCNVRQPHNKTTLLFRQHQLRKQEERSQQQQH